VTVQKNELIPSARRLMNSLRDLGYDFASAVADLADNSIEADASVVAIDVEFDGENSWVRIADNGRGMSPDQLKEALRYGSERDYSEQDLGKFGLGLKTASLSQCRRLTVASRTSAQRANVAAYCWDLDHISEVNRWEILPARVDEDGPSVRSPLRGTTGTVVLWEKLDRILAFHNPDGAAAQARLSAMCRELETHLAMVFHRFLAGEVRGKRLKILINGNEVTPWDPFARSEPRTKVRPTIELAVRNEGINGVVRLEPHVLPHQDDFSTPDAFRKASGPSNWNQQQGFYIYRAGRLIQSGGWCKLRTADEHTKLVRISLSFGPILDEAFKINVAKMRVQLPAQLRKEIEGIIAPVVKLAQETYRRRQAFGPPQAAPASEPAPLVRPPPRLGNHEPARHQISQPVQTASPIRGSSNRPEPTWSLAECQRALENVAEPDEKPVLNRLFLRLRARLNGRG
jgi:hypothetical protein